jgi:hypothetical protein
MSGLMYFSIGMIAGTYVGQTYDVPKVADVAQKIIRKISDIEKKPDKPAPKKDE